LVISHLIDLGLVLVFLLSAYGIGIWGWRVIRVKWEGRLERLIFSIGLGLTILGYVALGLGMAQLIYPSVFWTLTVLIFLLACKGLLREKTEVNPLPFRPEILGTLTLLFITLNIIKPLTPPTHVDSLTYHLAIPKRYIQDHGITYYPDLVHSNWQFIHQMLNLWSLTIGTETTAHLLNFCIEILCCMGLFYISLRQFNSSTIGWLSVCLFLSLDSVKDLTGTASDMFCYSFFQILLVAGFLNWARGDFTNRWLKVMAIFGGACIGSKMIGVIPLLAIAICVASFNRLSAIKLLTIAILIGAPWYLRTWLFTGNPIYPFGYGLLGGRDMDPQTYEVFYRYHLEFDGFKHTLLDLLKLPWLAIGWRTSLPMLLLPLVLLARPFMQGLKWPSIYTALFCLFWWMGSIQSRLLLPCHAILCIIVAVGIYHVHRFSLVGKVWHLVLIPFLTFSLGMRDGLPDIDMFEAAFSPEKRTQYLRRKIGTYKVTEYINSKLSNSETIFLYNDTRGYYIQKKHLIGYPPFQGLIPWYRFCDVQQATQHLRQLCVTHFMVDTQRGIWYNKKFTKEFLDSYAQLIYHRNAVYLYRLLPEPKREKGLRNIAPKAKIIASSDDGSSKGSVADGLNHRREFERGYTGWRSANPPSPKRPEWITFRFETLQTIQQINLYGFPSEERALRDFVFQINKDGRWLDLGSTRIRNNTEETEWFFRVSVQTREIRLLITRSNPGLAEVLEIELLTP
jgi:hypothetical protein